MRNFEIGTEIRNILMGNTALSDALTMEGKQGPEVKIYPIVADPEATFPFLIYRRMSYTPESDKDYVGEKIYVEFYLCSTKYSQSVELINMVADTLIDAETEIIDYIEITNLYEDYIYDTFVQYASVEITLKR